MKNISPILQAMMAAATQAGKLVMDSFQTEQQLTFKSSHQDIATETDKQSQKLIVETLTDSLKNNGIKKTKSDLLEKKT